MYTTTLQLFFKLKVEYANSYIYIYNVCEIAGTLIYVTTTCAHAQLPRERKNFVETHTEETYDYKEKKNEARAAEMCSEIKKNKRHLTQYRRRAERNRQLQLRYNACVKFSDEYPCATKELSYLYLSLFSSICAYVSAKISN